MAPHTSYKLNNGVQIPAVGLGTWQSKPGEVEKAVEHALKVGYRHIDTATCYQNENEVGQGIKASGVPRSEIFLTTKLWCTDHRKVQEALDRSLKSLGTDYLDLFLMHWPVPMNGEGNHHLFPTRADGKTDLDTEWSFVQTWKSLEKLVDSGKVKAIGVSNLDIPNLELLLKEAKVVPAVNQIELHPYLSQPELFKFCADKGIHITAYSPLGSTGSPLFNEPKVIELSKKYNVGPGTVLISYHVARGASVLPKSVTNERITENLKIIELKQEDVDALTAVASDASKKKRFVDPDWGTDVFHVKQN